jgi:hypothetical protein
MFAVGTLVKLRKNVTGDGCSGVVKSQVLNGQLGYIHTRGILVHWNDGVESMEDPVSLLQIY